VDGDLIAAIGELNSDLGFATVAFGLENIDAAQVDFFFVELTFCG